MSLRRTSLIKKIPYLVQSQSLSSTGSTRHAARLGVVREEEDAATAGDDHPDGPGLRGRGEEDGSASVTVNPEQGDGKSIF